MIAKQLASGRQGVSLSEESLIPCKVRPYVRL